MSQLEDGLNDIDEQSREMTQRMIRAAARPQRGFRGRRAGDKRSARGTRPTRRPSLEALRHSPMRNGLIGLAVAGTAAPMVLNRYQQAMRGDPSHELALARGMNTEGSAESASGVWRDMMRESDAAASLRESVVVQSLEQYADFSLSRELAEDIYDVATEADIDPAIAYGLVRAESSFRNTSTSPVGAIGLTQLMPRTAAWLEPGVTRAQLREPETNLRIGFQYLRSLIDKYEGDTDLALVAYNRGPGTVDRELKRGGDPDNGYSDFVKGVEGHGHTLYTTR